MNSKFDGYSKIIKTYGILAIFFIVVVLLSPDNAEDFGLLTLIPAAFLLIYIFYTKRILESLMLGGLLGFLMGNKGDFFSPLSDSFLEIMINEDIGWLFIVCGLMGSIIALIERAGGAYAFGEWVSKRAKTKKSTLLWTWVLGVVIFIDDYLNCLTVGASMSPLTDKHKVPREFLAYIVDSTAAPVCVLVPISTWAIFIGSLMEQNGMAPDGEGVAYFIRTIPFNFYGWFAALIVPLVIIGVVPIFGPMKKAFKRAEETGVLAPPGSEKIDMKAGENFDPPENAKLKSFFLPIIVLVASTIIFDVDMQKGVISTCAFIFVYYIATGIMGPEEYMDLLIAGIKNMLFPLFMVVLAYFFAAACDQIGFIDYVIGVGMRFMTPQMFPLVVFITFGITEFIMGLSWGMYVIAMPIVIPLAAALGANPFVAVGAVCSAGVWGSHICFYSDATILTSAATGCDNFRHAMTQLPYGMLGMLLSVIGFLIVGMLGV
ncbi:MAG: Na+/H+ antiporter NhaC family protein [Anaerovoracaceae bacterium]